MKKLSLLLKTVLFLLLFSACSKPEIRSEFRVETLTAGWKMQSSAGLAQTDESLISQSGFDTASWFQAMVPGTALGSIATTGVIEDPYFGINMQNIGPDQFKQPWWFRTSFHLDKKDLTKKISLRFNGINYRADLWVNGKKSSRKRSVCEDLPHVHQNRYGIREIRSYLNEDKNRAFEINGKFILLKGGGWTDDVLLQDTRKSVEAQLR